MGGTIYSLSGSFGPLYSKLTNVRNCISSWQVSVITPKELMKEFQRKFLIYLWPLSSYPGTKNMWFSDSPISSQLNFENFDWGGKSFYWVLQRKHGSWHRSNTKFLLASSSLYQINFNDIAEAASPSKKQ